MRVFGLTCWVVLHKSHIDGNFGGKAAKGVFLGYPDGSKAYKVILSDGKVFKARSVVFAETKVSEVAEVAEELPGDEVVEVEMGLRSASDGEDVDADNDDKDDDQDDGSDKSADDNQGCAGSQDTLRRSGRARRPPVEYWLPVSLIAHEAPTTYVQAVQGQESAKWRTAMDEEKEAIRKNKTCRLTDRRASRRVLKGKWVYKVKNEVDKNGNNTTRHKARLCFMGNRQIKGLDFNETFAPVAKFTTIRCILAMTAANGLELHQMDFKTAFLNGELDEEVYMEQPDEYVDATYPDKVCRLLRALYGLTQAPRICVAEIRAGDTDRERFLCTSAPQRVTCTPCTALGLSPSTLGDNHRGINRGHTTMDQHQWVRYRHTRMFRVPSTFINRCEGCKSHTMGHAGLPLPTSL